MTKDWNDEFLQQFAQHHRVSSGELRTLRLALGGQTAEAIAQSQGISAAAVRKRLSSVYTKFAIPGGGPGKLETLRHHIGQAYRAADRPIRQSDWGDAVSVASFYGRLQECRDLSSWLQADECRLIVLTGMGGIGKTTLAVNVARDHQTDYQVIWRSLREAPTLKALLQDVLTVLTQQGFAFQEDDTEEGIARLIDEFSQHPCLLVLDNAESIFESRTAIGEYRSGYEDYGKFFRRVGRSQHKSCVLMTSREKPPEVVTLEQESPHTRTLELEGAADIGQGILTDQALVGTDSQRQQLIDFYSGSPLALTLVSTTIKELFDGDIGEFLTQNYPLSHESPPDYPQGDYAPNGIATTSFEIPPDLPTPLPTPLPIVGGVRQLLDGQFDRLSSLEHRIMYWLAINREPISLKVLREDLVPSVPLNAVMEALERLRSRCLVSVARPSRLDGHGTGFTLRGFIMEYTTNQLVERMGTELKHGQLDLFRSYALIKASAKEHIRHSQKRLFLDPIIQTLLTWMTPNELEAWTKSILNELRNQTSAMPSVMLPNGLGTGSLSPSTVDQSSTLTGYAAGNILNLLIRLEVKISHYDFSHLAVWQADLRQARLHSVDFTGADLSKSAFTEVMGDILAVAYSPRGDLLAATDSDGQLHLWTTRDMVKQHTCDCQAGWVRTVAFSPDQTKVVTGDDRSAKIWDVETGQLLKTLQRHDDWVRSVCFALEGRVIVSCSDDQAIKLWDLDDEAADQEFACLTEHHSRIKAIASNADQTIVASASDDGSIQLWSLAVVPGSMARESMARDSVAPDSALDKTSANSSADEITVQLLRTIQVRHQVRFVSFHPTQPHILASSSDDQMIRLWDINTGFSIKEFSQNAWVRSLSFSRDGRYLASGGDDAQVRVWDIESGACVKRLLGHRSRIWCVAFSPDGKTLVSGSDSQALKFWDVAQEKCIKTLQGYTRGVRTLAFHPAKPWLVSGGDDKVVRLWALPPQAKALQVKSSQAKLAEDDVPQNNVQQDGLEPYPALYPDPESLCLKELKGHEGRIWSVAIHPDADHKWIASASDDDTIRLWNLETGHCLRLKGHQDWIRSVAFGRNPETGETILASGSDDRTIKLWDVTTGECLRTLGYHSDWVRAVAFNPNPKMPLLASGSDDQTVNDSDCTIKMWDLSTDCPYNTLQGESTSGVRALAFSPDGKLLASGSDDKMVRICDVESSQCRLKFPHHGGRVWSVAFSPDGRTLASSSDDRTVKVWDVGTGNIIQNLDDHSQRVRAVAFSADGSLLATGSQDGKIRLWDVQQDYRFIDRLKTLKPYAQSCIKSITGVTPAQKLALSELGAVSD